MEKILMHTNIQFKDRLFCSIFGKEENKKFLLELYNALNNSNYTNVDDLQLDIIDNVIYITMYSDVSFLIGSEINLYEQQSTYNPNMPLRGLMYFAQAYQSYLSKIKKDLYGTKLVKIPTPKFIVFYNGNKELDDITTLKLSDAFEKTDTTGNFEWTATVININKNHNSTLLNSCKSLYHYSEFVAMVKENLLAGLSKNNAINQAVNFAIKQNFLDGYFKKQKSEVLGMSLTEFDEEEFIQNRRQEGREEGLIEGERKGAHQAKLETAKNFIKMNFPLEQIALGTGLSLEQVQQIKEEVVTV